MSKYGAYSQWAHEPVQQLMKARKAVIGAEPTDAKKSYFSRHKLIHYQQQKLRLFE